MSVAKELLEREKEWNAAIQRGDVTQMDDYLEDGFFLAIGVQGMPLQITPRDRWLEILPAYKIESFNFDDVQVHVYRDTSVVLMLYTQIATVRGQDRSGQLLITDIWVNGSKGWRIAERHSSRPEVPALTRPE
jgi:ketosteroid isomerase-like protein